MSMGIVAELLIREAGADAMVLLKNAGALPFPKGTTVAVIGPNARAARIMGSGSAQLDAAADDGVAACPAFRTAR